MIRPSTWAPVLVAATLPGGFRVSHTGIRPSFYLDYSMWTATDIVSHNPEGAEVDGHFALLER